MKRQVCLLRLKSSLPRNVLYQDICDILCAELNGISKTLSVFDEIAKAESPKGTSPSDQQLKAKKVFIKATIDQNLQERASRIQITAGIVQVCQPIVSGLSQFYIIFQALLPQNSLQ